VQTVFISKNNDLLSNKNKMGKNHSKLNIMHTDISKSEYLSIILRTQKSLKK